MNSITLDQLIQMNPCARYTKNNFEYSKELFNHREYLNPKDILSLEISNSDKIWVLVNMLSKKQSVELIYNFIDNVYFIYDDFSWSTEKAYKKFRPFVKRFELFMYGLNLYLQNKMSFKVLSNRYKKLLQEYEKSYVYFNNYSKSLNHVFFKTFITRLRYFFLNSSFVNNPSYSPLLKNPLYFIFIDVCRLHFEITGNDVYQDFIDITIEILKGVEI